MIAGALVRQAKGLDPVAPDPNVSHAADTLRMLHGRAPASREVTALDAYLVTVCDHGMNASTFATRVVASTHANLFAAVTAGYCALTGTAAWRRAGAGAGNARRDRLDANASSPGSTRRWRAANG